MKACLKFVNCLKKVKQHEFPLLLELLSRLKLMSKMLEMHFQPIAGHTDFENFLGGMAQTPQKGTPNFFKPDYLQVLYSTTLAGL